jgi:hypothetical protein
MESLTHFPVSIVRVGLKYVIMWCFTGATLIVPFLAGWDMHKQPETLSLVLIK